MKKKIENTIKDFTHYKNLYHLNGPLGERSNQIKDLKKALNTQNPEDVNFYNEALIRFYIDFGHDYFTILIETLFETNTENTENTEKMNQWIQQHITAAITILALHDFKNYKDHQYQEYISHIHNIHLGSSHAKSVQDVDNNIKQINDPHVKDALLQKLYAVVALKKKYNTIDDFFDHNPAQKEKYINSEDFYYEYYKIKKKAQDDIMQITNLYEKLAVLRSLHKSNEYVALKNWIRENQDKSGELNVPQKLHGVMPEKYTFHAQERKSWIDILATKIFGDKDKKHEDFEEAKKKYCKNYDNKPSAEEDAEIIKELYNNLDSKNTQHQKFYIEHGKEKFKQHQLNKCGKKISKAIKIKSYQVVPDTHASYVEITDDVSSLDNSTKNVLNSINNLDKTNLPALYNKIQVNDTLDATERPAWQQKLCVKFALANGLEALWQHQERKEEFENSEDFYYEYYDNKHRSDRNNVNIQEILNKTWNIAEKKALLRLTGKRQDYYNLSNTLETKNTLVRKSSDSQKEKDRESNSDADLDREKTLVRPRHSTTSTTLSRDRTISKPKDQQIKTQEQKEREQKVSEQNNTEEKIEIVKPYKKKISFVSRLSNTLSTFTFSVFSKNPEDTAMYTPNNYDVITQEMENEEIAVNLMWQLFEKYKECVTKSITEPKETKDAIKRLKQYYKENACQIRHLTQEQRQSVQDNTKKIENFNFLTHQSQNQLTSQQFAEKLLLIDDLDVIYNILSTAGCTGSNPTNDKDKTNPSLDAFNNILKMELKSENMIELTPEKTISPPLLEKCSKISYCAKKTSAIGL